MQITVRAAHYEPSPEIYEYLEQKLTPFVTQLPTIEEAYVMLSHESGHSPEEVATVEVSLRLSDDGDAGLLAHVSATTSPEAIDLVTAKLKGQVSHYKDRRDAKDKHMLREMRGK